MNTQQEIEILKKAMKEKSGFMYLRYETLSIRLLKANFPYTLNQHYHRGQHGLRYSWTAHWGVSSCYINEMMSMDPVSGIRKACDQLIAALEKFQAQFSASNENLDAFISDLNKKAQETDLTLSVDRPGSVMNKLMNVDNSEYKYRVYCFTYKYGGHFKYFRHLDEANRCADKYGALVQVVESKHQVAS